MNEFEEKKARLIATFPTEEEEEEEMMQAELDLIRATERPKKLNDG